MKDTKTYKIFTELEEIESRYENVYQEKIDGLKRSQYQVIKMCEYYSDSRYLEANYGNRLNKTGRPVPFSNIVNYRVALAKTATDLDIQNFTITADDPKHQVHSMLLNREVFEWMKTTGFALTLNQMGLNRPKYGGYLLKKTEKDGELKIDVVRWTSVYTDQNDILGGPIVEEHHLSPVEINRKSDVWYGTDDVLRAYKKIKSADTAASIEVYEITGEFPIAMYKDASGEEATEEDEYQYSLQHYFIAELDGQNYLMFAEELSGTMEDYYAYLSWEDNGYGLGRGVIEDSEEAQVWTNDAVINESIAMALAGRVGVKTNSKKLGNNILEHDHGKIYELEDGKDINAFQLTPSALGQYANIIERWKRQADNVANSYDAATGEQPPSGTPLGTTQLLNAVATKPFDYKREEWGIHLTMIFDKWVLPYLMKKIAREHILVSEFDDTELEAIDDSFSAFNNNEDMINATIEALNNDTPLPTQQDNLDNQAMWKQHIKKNGKKRYIEVPKDYFKDVQAKLTVNVTGEQKNKSAILQSLSSIMASVVQSYNPNTGGFGVLEDPTLSKIFNQMLEMAGAGISPISVGKSQAKVGSPVAPPAAPVPVPVAQAPALSEPMAG